ncbi:tyrosine-type recombinase/integrase [Mycobacterium canetti]|uniref:tyrosine-type recombinase/integrase n=1 Tax=Mycobacterium canetti TaxID=78331 RepID=UPI0005C708A6|nr:site-specific integrase [Mycobacterium canetti]
MGRRTKGDGSLFKRNDGQWIGRVELPPFGPDGKRRYRYVSSRSFDVAAEKLRTLRHDVAEGRIAVTGNTTVAMWLDRWLTEIHADKIRPTTRRDYQTAITLHISPVIGSKRLDNLTPQHVRQMHAAVGKRRAAVKAHVILQRALKDAVREGMITRNVAEMVDPPRYKRARRTSLSVDVAKRIIATAYASRDESQATRWAAAFLTGARQSELLGLRWSYVDLDNGYADISWQLQQLTQVHGCGEKTDAGWPCGKKRPGWCPKRHWDLPPDFEHEICHRSLVWTRPKTEAGGRLVPVVAPLLAKLCELHTHQGINPHNLVWHYPDGRPIGPREDYKAWKQLLIDTGVIAPEGETLSMHTARHTTASLLRAAGVDEQTRMEVLGHATVDAQRIYAHPDHTRHLEAMSNLNQLLAL